MSRGYGFRAQFDGEFSSQNKQHGWSAVAAGESLEIQSNTRNSWTARWSLERWGRGDNLFPWPAAEGAERSADDELLRFVASSLESWIRNEPCGVEQGWTVRTPPTPFAREGMLTLELEITGLRPEFLPNGRDLLLRSADGSPQLYYSGLRSWDATGKDLRSEFELERTAAGGILRILVDDRDAVYPVEIDPLITAAPFWSRPGGQPQSQFGYAISGGGDLDGDGLDDLVVGAHKIDNDDIDEGRVYLFPGTPPNPPSGEGPEFGQRVLPRRRSKRGCWNRPG